jgi:hypothetical protein
MQKMFSIAGKVMYQCVNCDHVKKL